MNDITRPIEPFYITQTYGVNQASYAKFGLKGHNGWDLRTKYSDTPEGRRHILSSFLARQYYIGNEGAKGFGKYFEVIVQLKRTWKLRYAHCHSIQSFITKSEGEDMAISDNTGNSTGPHVHFDVKLVDFINGKITKTHNYNNGYFGNINPQLFFDELREYKKTMANTSTDIAVESKVYEMLVGQSTKLDAVHEFLGVDGDPKTTPIDRYKNTITGIKSDAKTVRSELDVAKVEITNRGELISRLDARLLEKDIRINSLLNQPNENDKIIAKLQGAMVDLERTKNSELDIVYKEKGRALTALASCQSELVNPSANTLLAWLKTRVIDPLVKWLSSNIKKTSYDKKA